MFDIPAPTLLSWVNEVRIWAGWVAAAAAVTAGVAGYAQIRLQSTVGREKDAALETFKAESAERIAKAGAEAARANEQTARLSAEAEAARLEQERIREQNLNLSLTLERERAERLKLEGRLASRRLSGEQAQAIARSIRAETFVPMAVVTRLGDKEASDYATQIIGALQAARVSVQIHDVGVMAPPPYGLIVHGDVGSPIVRALQAADLSPRLFPANGPAPRIVVGLKPPQI